MRSVWAFAIAIGLGLGLGATACQSADAAHERPGRPEAAKAAAPRTGDPVDDQCLVDFIDVGSGLAVFIRCKPAGHDVVNILYDGGSIDGTMNKQGRLAYILDKGLGFKPGATIHHLFHSHPHYDHHSDLIRENGIIQNYVVNHVWDPAALNNTSAGTPTAGYACFIKDVIISANKKGTIYHPGRKCPVFTDLRCKGPGAPVGLMPAWDDKAASVKPFDPPARGEPTNGPVDVPLGTPGVTATILHADPDSPKRKPNEASMVVKLDLFGVIVLLAGDEEAGRHAAADTEPKPKSVEQYLLDKYTDLKAHIVQVPHHGSESSSSNLFQNAVIIKDRGRVDTVAVISAGPKVFAEDEDEVEVTLPTPRILESWQRKLGRGRVVSTRLNDRFPPKCVGSMDKIAPDPANDKTMAGCNNIQFVISAKARGRKITTANYWPMGGKIL
jgi:beta-lactamase superfamily II metal-dependent hydrolase